MKASLTPKHGECCLTWVLYTNQQQSLEHLRLYVFLIVQCQLLPLTKTYSFHNETGVWKRTILFSLFCMTMTNYAAKIPLTFQVRKGKKKTGT